METNATRVTRNRLYEDFEPYCKWVKEEGQEISLEIDLKGFKKEQLKVQTNKRVLTIQGERPLDGSNDKWSRFHKEIRVPKDCNVDGIHAKFSNGTLFIVMPKMVQHCAVQHVKDNSAVHKNHSIFRAKTMKGTAIKVAIGIGAIGAIVAFGTYYTIRIRTSKYISP